MQSSFRAIRRLAGLMKQELQIGPEASSLRALAAGSVSAIPEDLSLPPAQRGQYKNLSLIDLRAIRWSLYRGGPLSSRSEEWVEVALRFCELNIWRLDWSMRQKWGTAARLGIVGTAALLLEGHLVYRDPRLLNTVLKIHGSGLFRSARQAHPPDGIAALAAAVTDVSDKCVQHYRQR